MIDSQTKQEIRVFQDETGGPYIMAPLSQLSRIRERLDLNGIEYWVDAHAISLGGKPAVIFINIGHSEDAKKVQAILDEAA